MPTYEYVCDAGHETEARQSMGDDALETCPRDACGSPARRVISGGSGFLMGESASSGASAGTGGGACGPSCCRTSGSSAFT